MKTKLTPLTIVLLYAITGGLWILFSDRILVSLAADPATVARLQTYKGWLFVAVTAVLLLHLISRYAAENEKTIAALSKSEAYNRDLFLHSTIGLAVCRMDGSLADVNPAYARIIGRSVEETLSLTYWDITPEKYADDEAKQLESLKLTGSYGPYEKEYIHKDGRLIPVRLQGRIIEQKGEKYIWSSVEDITERKIVEKELLTRETQLRLFVEYSPAAIAMFDLEMKYLVASRRWNSDYNLGDRQITGRSHYDIFPDLPERWKEIHKRCLAGAVEMCEEDPFPRADGHIDWVRWEIHPWKQSDGKIGGIIIFSEVITRRKNAEEEIKTINKELIAINSIITAISGVSSIKEILEKVLDEVLGITGLEGGTICIATPQNTLQLAAHRATSEATILDLTANEIKIGDCLCGECAWDHKTLILRDREAVLKFATREATRGEDIRFHAAFPLITGGRCLGVLCVFTRTDKKPEERRLKLIETVTLQIAIAVQNAGLFEETLRSSAILEDMVKDRTAELEDKTVTLERLNRLFVGRELRLIELKEKIKGLESGSQESGDRSQIEQKKT
jgi:PAS domain S-box-containing protein